MFNSIKLQKGVYIDYLNRYLFGSRREKQRQVQDDGVDGGSCDPTALELASSS